MLRGWINKVKEPGCIHKYNFIKTQDSENFKTGQIGTASFISVKSVEKKRLNINITVI